MPSNPGWAANRNLVGRQSGSGLCRSPLVFRWSGASEGRITQDVRRQVRPCLETLGLGGYVFASYHNFRADVAPEKAEAMLAAASRLRG